MQFRVLGPLEVDAGDGPIPLGGPKQRAVLASLLVRPNEVVPASTLIAEIWGDDPPDKARNTLQTYVSNLRRTLGAGRLQGRSPGYVLLVDPPELDSCRFDALVREAKRSLPTDPAAGVDSLEEALALWRGPALADLSDQDSLLPEATRLNELRVQAETDRIQGLLAAGASARAVGELEALVARHPLREHLWELLMLALYREGRQAEALGAYHRARELLADELGVDPSPELSGLQGRILDHDPNLDLRGRGLRGYQLLETIGEGPSGVVHRAIQPHVAREVAIKVIAPSLANNPDFIRRFDAEAQVIARLEHPHIVPLYDYWRDPDGAYLVMRFLGGGSLRGRIETTGAIQAGDLAPLVGQIAQALATAHRQGVVHRDVKPENVLLDQDGNAYLADFAIAKDASEGRATHTGSIGTPAYLSPEQIRGERVTPQTDVYGLGVTLFECLTGRHAFPEGSIASLLERVLHQPVPSVLTDRPDLPSSLDEVIGQATAKEPALRYPDALALATAFERAIGAGTRIHSSVDVPNPYKGLRPFTEADSADFFGREAFIERLVGRLAEGGDRARFLAVVGPSGSGKSSVVRAGLIPALRAGTVDGSADWFYVEMAPGAHPLNELGSALLTVATRRTSDLGEILADDDRGLSAAIDAILPDRARLLLVVDQLEETFTLVDDEAERRGFLDLLAQARGDPRVTVVATLRADFYDRPLTYPGFGELLAAHTEALPVLSPEDLEQAIREPAEQVGVQTEPGAVAEMIADVAQQPGALPLVQYALTEAFEHRVDGQITLDIYQAVGGIAGALSTRAERLYGDADDLGRRAIRQVFLRLVTLGEGREDTRRLVSRSELNALGFEPAVLDGVLEAFGRHRLLTFDREPATREPTVEIAHEALLGAWEQFHGWIDAAREDLRAERRLARSTVEWRAADGDPSFLIRGARLEQVEAWVHTTDLALGHPELAFVKASLDQRDAELQAERRRHERELRTEHRSRNRLRGLVALFAVAALVAATLTILATNQSERASHEAAIASAREIAAAAVASIDEDPERAILLAIEAVRATRSVDGTVLPEAEDALHRTIAASRVLATLDEPGGAVAWGPKGTFALERADRPGVIEIRDAETTSVVASFAAHGGDITGIEYSPDGSLLATTGDDGTLGVWSTDDGRPVSSVSGQGTALGVSFGAGGQRLAATWPRERAVRIVDLAAGRVVSKLALEAYDTSLDPSGTMIALVEPVEFDPDQEVAAGVLFDVSSGEQVMAPFRPSSISDTLYSVSSVAWSPDGQSVATAGLGGLDLWDAQTGGLQAYRPGAFGEDLAWSADSTILVSGGPAARVWRASPSDIETIATLRPSGTNVELAAGGLGVSPQGNRVIASASSGTVTTWDVSIQGDAEWAHLDALPYFGTVALLPNGDLVATDPQGAIAVWDLEGLRPVRTIGSPYLGEAGFDVSNDGLSVSAWNPEEAAIFDLATGDRELTLPPTCGRLWDPAGSRLLEDGGNPIHLCDRAGKVVAELDDAQGRYAWTARFSPDGRFVAAAIEGPSAGVDIFDLKTGEIVRTLDTGTGADALALEFGNERLLVGGEHPTLWNTRTWEPIVELAGRPSVCDATFSPDGSRLATAGQDGIVRIFDPSTGRQLLALRGHSLATCSVDFSADGTRLASQSPGEVRVWALDIDDLLEIARDSVTRSLTDAECRQYLHIDACPAN